MTWTAAGGLPLGVILTTSETEIVVARGLRMLAGMLPNGKCASLWAMIYFKIKEDIGVSPKDHFIKLTT